jgi:hypothetical protein
MVDNIIKKSLKIPNGNHDPSVEEEQTTQSRWRSWKHPTSSEFFMLPLVEQELLTHPEHPSLPQVFSGFRVTRSLVLCVRRTDNTMVQKDKQRSTKYTHKTKDRVTRNPLKTWGKLGCSGWVSSSCPFLTWNPGSAPVTMTQYCTCRKSEYWLQMASVVSLRVWYLWCGSCYTRIINNDLQNIHIKLKIE